MCQKTRPGQLSGPFCVYRSVPRVARSVVARWPESFDALSAQKRLEGIDLFQRHGQVRGDPWAVVDRLQSRPALVRPVAQGLFVGEIERQSVCALRAVL